ncbi:O-Glycosyl hydrolase [Flavobacterium flevense]|uniref:Uncharacterized protein n=1 Tax=Flavobacterium flevense TaxID=983 RepID=A0A4Y4B0X4_9FLAO|nr:hypothetical protein [Flavobacterium flevense]GEC72767.1 hypothetical protein FFL01_23060 [Flavobacterium flevense]SHM16513.1 O-Glycosyl hydrolase [Flavobacterium flevense]
MKRNSFETISCLLVFLVFFTNCSRNGSDGSEEVGQPTPIPTPNKTVHSVISFNNPGKLIDVFFYDIKQATKNLNNASEANEIFNIDDNNGLRVPIRGENNLPAHPSAGVVVEDMYNDVLTTISLAKQARGTKELKIFASKKLDGQTSFPSWVKDANGIIPAKYAILIADFIQFMKSKGVQIDYLGIDNEFVYNEGNITPQKYAQTIAALRILAIEKGFAMPVLVGYEDYGPNKNNWVKNLIDNGWGDTMDIYGTHYYPQFRPKDKLLVDLAFIGNRPFWSTEPHWDAKAEVDDFSEAEEGILALWDQIDIGMSGFMWWSYSIGENLRGKLMRAVSVPLLGARPIKVTDIDGESITTLGKLQTRAFIENKTITVYAVNMNETVRNDYTFKLESTSIEGKVDALQWTATTPIAGQQTSVNSEGTDKNIFSLTLPKRSITRFTFTIK